MTNRTKQSLNQNEHLLSQEQLIALEARIDSNAMQWLERNLHKKTSKSKRKVKSNRGPKPKIIENPFYGFIGCTRHWGRYPVFALDIIEGIARLDWHSRTIGVGGKSMPLSVCNLAVILECLPIVTNEAVEVLLHLKERHARRYVNAIELIIPWMMKSRPQSLINEMKGIDPEPEACEWEDWDEARNTTAEELAKLHYDLRTLTQFNAAEEYEAALSGTSTQASINHHLGRKEHPMKATVMQMLRDDVQVKPISRETGVDPKTIRKWRDEEAALKASQAA